jgi:hypothetical protein
MSSINPSVLLTAPPMVLWSVIAMVGLTFIISRGHRMEVLVGLVVVSFPIYAAVFFAKQVAAVISGMIVSLAILTTPHA